MFQKDIERDINGVIKVMQMMTGVWNRNSANT